MTVYVYLFSIFRDEFLNFVVEEAKSQLEAAKPRPLASIDKVEQRGIIAQPKDMIGAAQVLQRHSLLATFSMIRREVYFWNIDTHVRVGYATVPSLSEVNPACGILPSKTVAGRSMAYLPSSGGTLYVASGTDALILQYDCRRFRVRREIFPPNNPSCMCTAWNPSMARNMSNVEAVMWLLVGDVDGYVSCYECKNHTQVPERERADECAPSHNSCACIYIRKGIFEIT
jgi:hypothetical protein